MGEGALDDDARVDFGAVDAAAKQFLEGQGAVAVIQIQHRKDFVIQAAQPACEIAPGGAGVGQGFAALKACGQMAVAKLQCRRQQAGAGRANATQGSQCARVAVQQGPQAAVFGKQRAGRAHGILAGSARAQEQCQQFGIRELLWAAGQQFFAGTFVGGPVADMHAGSLPGSRGVKQQNRARHRVSWALVRKSGNGVTQDPNPLPLAGCRVLLCVCGGIAAYKSADLVRRLGDAGAQVQVAMTENAQRFVSAQTFQALSHRPVRTSLWDAHAEAAMGHLELAGWAQRVVVAPATANMLAKLAHGLADDLVSTMCLASEAPLLVAPAMNHRMWRHPATQANLATLLARGVRVVGPGDGPLAEGESGPGRMAEPLEIVAALEAMA